MPLPSHLLMPFYRIESRRTITFCPANIYICFKSSDRHIYDLFYLICFCFDNIHLTSPDCLANVVIPLSTKPVLCIQHQFFIIITSI